MTQGPGGSQPPWEEQDYPPQHYGQRYPPDQQWQPQRYDPYAHQRRVNGPREDPRQQGPYSSQGYQQPTPWNTSQIQNGYGRFQPQEPERPRRPRWPLYAGIVALVAVAGGGIAYALAGHGTEKPLTCQQQYDNWRHGSADAIAQRFKDDTAALTKAGNSEDLPEMTAALKKLGDDGAALETYPMPACADPHGYYAQMLADFKAAGDNAASASGLGGLMLAMDPAKKAETLASKIDAELKAAHISTAS
jgi:hypothetical protein